MNVCIYVDMYVCMYAYMYVYSYVSTWTDIYESVLYVGMCQFMNVCIYVYICHKRVVSQTLQTLGSIVCVQDTSQQCISNPNKTSD